MIKHEDIKGFMPGMTMPFKVRDRSLLEGKTPGDLVDATLMVQDTDAWLSTLSVSGHAPLAESATFAPAAFVEPLEPGELAPDTLLTAQDGSPTSVRGNQPVAVTFIYVRCPLPQFCPMLDRRFADVQRAIKSDAALNGRVRLLSVSFDPDADTPERLRAHAEKRGADPDIWTFATAPRDVVDRFAAHFGVNVIREADATITHNMRTAVIGADGRVIRIHDGADWKTGDIVDDLRRGLAP